MRLHLRIESENPAHVRFTMFVNGVCCGKAQTMRAEEFQEYVSWLGRGKRENGFEVTSTFGLLPVPSKSGKMDTARTPEPRT